MKRAVTDAVLISIAPLPGTSLSKSPHDPCRRWPRRIKPSAMTRGRLSWRSLSFPCLELSGLDIAYRPTALPAHPVTGSRVPDLPTDDGTVFGNLTAGRALLLSFLGPSVSQDAAGAAAALGIPARLAQPWPGHEKVAAALIRPDGYVSWAVDEPADNELMTALNAFGVRF
jgi:hypothetical protein